MTTNNSNKLSTIALFYASLANFDRIQAHRETVRLDRSTEEMFNCDAQFMGASIACQIVANMLSRCHPEVRGSVLKHLL